MPLNFGLGRAVRRINREPEDLPERSVCILDRGRHFPAEEKWMLPFRKEQSSGAFME